MTRVLVVDDDPQLLRAPRIALAAQDFGVELAVDGQSALEAVVKHPPDVVVLDLGLPDLDGIDVLRRIRQESDVPVIVLSARHETPEKIRAVDEGADDYVTKPFGMPELLARVRAAARRAGAMARRRLGSVRTRSASTTAPRRGSGSAAPLPAASPKPCTAPSRPDRRPTAA